jgi:hypothetical protein
MPRDGEPFSGEKAIIKLSWTSNHTLKVDECYLVTMRWTEAGAPASNPVCIQETFWFVDDALYLRADQETDRVYFWTVTIVRQGTDDEGMQTYLPLSSSSEEWSFYWK